LECGGKRSATPLWNMIMFKFERRHEKLAPFPVFVKRILAAQGIAIGMIAVALSIGIFGYHYLAEFGWLDSLLEASMILGGMGPINPLRTDSAKIFASFYALFSGLIFIALMGVVLSPVVHRIMHSFHIDEEDVKRGSRKH
jgi:hypothetical protein